MSSIQPQVTNIDQTSDEVFLSYLLDKEFLKSVDIDTVHAALQGTQEPLVVIINRLGLISEYNIAKSVADFLDIAMTADHALPDTAILTNTLAERFLKTNKIVPISDLESVTVAMSNPFNQHAINSIAFATEKSIQITVMENSKLDELIERLYGENREEVDRLVSEFGSEVELSEFEAEQLKDMASEAPIVRLVNLIIQRAIQVSASDIHIEPFENTFVIRQRIDGILKSAQSLPTESAPAVISRIKLMARLNIAETRLPQDGRIRMRIQGHDIDLRVSTIPTLHGESIAIRLLLRENKTITLKSLGFSQHALKRYNDALAIPHGIILVTGPTGSGKTTTLYATLNRLHNNERKIISVEDPVEYELTGINQIQVKPQIGLSFANALRSIVRQDPDIIMIGEMRDAETAEIATQAALTGHMVLSTLHTNDAASAITRLLDMGIADYIITSTVTTIVAQRLVRTLCQFCKKPYMPTNDLINNLPYENDDVTFFNAVGCSCCANTGYRGRTTISEVLLLDDMIKSMVHQQTDSTKLQQLAIEHGMITMQKDGLNKAAQGITTIDEVFRITN